MTFELKKPSTAVSDDKLIKSEFVFMFMYEDQHIQQT
jgi:hypothetical protein